MIIWGPKIIVGIARTATGYQISPPVLHLYFLQRNLDAIPADDSRESYFTHPGAPRASRAGQRIRPRDANIWMFILDVTQAKSNLNYS